MSAPAPKRELSPGPVTVPKRELSPGPVTVPKRGHSPVPVAVSVSQRQLTPVPPREQPLVTVSWLKETLAQTPTAVQILDTSWHFPTYKRDARKEFTEKHIPKAQFFDTDAFLEETPVAHEFGDAVGKLGVGNNSYVIVYDNNSNLGMYSAPRVWWLFRYFGHENVSILDGGLPKWQEAGYETSTVVDKVKPETFVALPNPALIRTIEDVEANFVKKLFTLVDGRSAGRFLGTAPEPFPNVKSGHIVDAVNIPFISLLDPHNKTLLAADSLRKVFKNAGVDMSKPVVAMCGSGLSACFLILACYTCGKQIVPLYDGSWIEYYANGKPQNKVIPDKD